MICVDLGIVGKGGVIGTMLPSKEQKLLSSAVHCTTSILLLFRILVISWILLNVSKLVESCENTSGVWSSWCWTIVADAIGFGEEQNFDSGPDCCGFGTLHLAVDLGKVRILAHLAAEVGHSVTNLCELLVNVLEADFEGAVVLVLLHAVFGDLDPSVDMARDFVTFLRCLRGTLLSISSYILLVSLKAWQIQWLPSA